jgi:hypothetical protein
VGGMLFSTFLTLVLVPVLYSLLARFTRAERREEKPVAESEVNTPPEQPLGGPEPQHAVG